MWARSKAVQSFLLAGLLAIPAFSANTTPQPGTLNYIEGQASLGQEPLNTNSVRSTAMQAGQTLTTQDGRVEILLTPGVFLRVDKHSSVRMDSPELANTAISVESGRAMVEVNDLKRENRIAVQMGDSSTQIMKKGLYQFDANAGLVRVFDGKVEVQARGEKKTVKGGHVLDLRAEKLKAQGFDKDSVQDEFYRWSSLRDAYLAEANVHAAGTYYAYGGYGPGWYGSGWYWDPWYGSYTWIPGAGYWYSPFGWGFYSPGFLYAAPYFGYGWYPYGGYYRQFGPNYYPRVRPHLPGSRYRSGMGSTGAGFRGTGVNGFSSGAIAPGSAFRGGAIAPGSGLHGGAIPNGSAFQAGGAPGGFRGGFGGFRGGFGGFRGGFGGFRGGFGGFRGGFGHGGFGHSGGR
jgi:hypothetical protein